MSKGASKRDTHEADDAGLTRPEALEAVGKPKLIASITRVARSGHASPNKERISSRHEGDRDDDKLP